MKRRAFLARLAGLAVALVGGGKALEGLELCPRCGRLDREVAAGFETCRRCFDQETEEMGRRWELQYQSPPALPNDALEYFANEYVVDEPYGLAGIVDLESAQRTFNRIQGSRLDAWR